MKGALNTPDLPSGGMQPGPPETRPSREVTPRHFGGICSRIPLLTRSRRHHRSTVDKKGCRNPEPERRRLVVCRHVCTLTGGAAGCRGAVSSSPEGMGPPTAAQGKVCGVCRLPVASAPSFDRSVVPGPVRGIWGAAQAPGRAPTAASCQARPVGGLGSDGVRERGRRRKAGAFRARASQGHSERRLGPEHSLGWPGGTVLLLDTLFTVSTDAPMTKGECKSLT